MDFNEINIADLAKQMNICKTMAQVLPIFHEKTGLSAHFVFRYDPEQQGMVIDLGFLPRPPNENEWNILVQQIFDTEKLMMSNYVLTSIEKVDNLEQLKFRHTEEINQIIDKRK